MKIIICIAIVVLAYMIGVHVGKNTVKIACPGIIKIAMDEEKTRAGPVM